MTRRRPAQIRADGPWHSRTTVTGVPTIPGLSYRGRIAVARLERERYWPGAVEEALRAWSLFLRDPWHRLFDPAQSCGVMLCCPDPVELHALLDAVVHVLPKKDARVLRKRIGDLDDLW
jgi:hypothetical protein